MLKAIEKNLVDLDKKLFLHSLLKAVHCTCTIIDYLKKKFLKKKKITGLETKILFSSVGLLAAFLSVVLCGLLPCHKIFFLSLLVVSTFQQVHKEPSFHLVFSVCTLHVVHGAWRSRTLHKPDIPSDLVFFPGT